MRKLLGGVSGEERRREEEHRRAEERVVADLREAALRVIYVREKAGQPGGSRLDVNPHSPDVSTYSLASMLTFEISGHPERGSLGRVVHMIFAGKPERIEERRRWVAWELEQLGHTAAARLLSDLTREEAVDYMGPGVVPLGAEG
jgi:hypothetical protein